MASFCYFPKASQSTIITALVLILINTYACLCQPLPLNFKTIISFGDSLTDTGNLPKILGSNHKPMNVESLPYGETYFGAPTGRWSNGRLIIDFIAQSFGLDLVPADYGPSYNSSTRNFTQGSNFAVAGSTALDEKYLWDKYGVKTPFANVSLARQLAWYRDSFLPTYCVGPQECNQFLKDTLFLVGEIGGNDYNDALLSNNKTLDDIQALIPEVIRQISSTVSDLIGMGASTLLVPGNFPIGCTPKYLTLFQTLNPKDYDQNQCLIAPNEFTKRHNDLLQKEIANLVKMWAGINIIYGDYYNGAMKIYSNPENYGFSKDLYLRACCGAPGPYSISLTVNCGEQGSLTCDDPSKYVSWDGLHFTDAAAQTVTTELLGRTPALFQRRY